MSTDRGVTIIVSDLHMGGGAADPWDDHVYQNHDFARFLETLLQRDEGGGDTELIINGDFLEFAQVRPDVYTLGSAHYWCSEEESLTKLEAILNGHREVFSSLQAFGRAGNRITIAAGNHDVDLYWPKVQARLSEVSGPIEFELGVEWIYRYRGRLAISHGHQLDRANSFGHWNDPVLTSVKGPKRLEMCPGTLFMVKFVNLLERKFPFADNLKPFTSLIRLLFTSDQPGLLAVAWMMFRFASRHSLVTLDSSGPAATMPELMRQSVKYNDDFKDALLGLAQRHLGSGPSEIAGLSTASDQELESFLTRLFIESESDEWLKTFRHLNLGTTLGSDSPTTLGLIPSMMEDSVSLFRQTAINVMSGLRSMQQVVVLGHTHQPDRWVSSDSTDAYFNTGSWTRFIRYQDAARLTMEALKDEAAFPYELNFVRVTPGPDDRLVASMIAFDKSSGTLFD